MKRVLVALSGGVDSSVSAYLLKEKGFNLIAVTLFLWDKDTNQRACCGISALNIAKRVSYKLGIPHYTFDLREEFEKEIVFPFIKTYENGKTPNPCVFCNRFFKFGFLIEKMKELRCDYMATGHYSRIVKKKGKYYFKKAIDLKRDQSYFLGFVKKEVLPFLLFPLGEMSKEKVREIAKKANLPTRFAQDSQDLCFINGTYRDFLKNYISEKEGNILHSDGRILGKHKGIFNFTYGQRKGLGITSKKPLYVLKFEPERHNVIVAEREHIFKKEIKVENINWFEEPSAEFFAECQIRHLHKPAFSLVKVISPDKAIVCFEKPQFAPAPGQFAGFYKDSLLIGGGWIE